MTDMTPARKRLAILIVVVGSALIGERLYSLAMADSEVHEPVATKRAPRSTAAVGAAEGAADSASAPPAGLHIDRLDARQLALSESVDPWPRTQQFAPFENVNWQAPGLKPPPPPKPPEAVAPPFAYAYLGGLTEDGVRTTFFTQGDRILAVKVGDTVDAAYRVDQMTEKQMQLTYLPLDKTLVLALGDRP